MLVKLANDWFDGAGYHKQGVIEYNGEESDLPSSAVVLSPTGTLPVASNTPKAGFGAKPAEEQLMDALGAGPTHQINLNTGTAATLTDAEREEKAKASAEAETKRDEAAAKERDDAIAAEQARIAELLPKVEEAAKELEKATDPLAIFNEPQAKPAPKK
jgi:hypothetical protein